jgi:K+-sensing histidine kinase KdpD
MMAQDPAAAEEIQVPLPRVAGFIRQVTHDVRNGLNSMDLQAAYMAELLTDPEAQEELSRLRGLIQNTARQLQSLSSNFYTTKPSLVVYSIGILVEDLQARLLKGFPEKAAEVTWKVDIGEEEAVAIDIEMFFGAIIRLFENAFGYAEPGGSIAADARIEDDRFVLVISETRSSVPSDPDRWGEEPFVSTRRGGYGLGIFRARAFLSAQSGDLQISHDSGRNLLLTRVSLPLAHPHE